MTISKKLSAALLAAGVVVGAQSAQGAITISIFDASTYNPTFGQTPFVGEDFEQLGADLGEGEAEDGANGLDTAVGQFFAIGGTGTGGTVGQVSPNDGLEVALRDGSVFGRSNTTPDDGNWFLDSNDTFGIKWVAEVGGTLFNRVMFTLSDAADQGAFVRVEAHGDTATLSSEANGAVKLVDILFDTPTDLAHIFIENFASSDQDALRTNDGYGIDGAQISVIPVPAAGLLFLTALGGAGVAYRRRKS